MRAAVVALLAVCLVAVGTVPATAAERTEYVVPVDAPVVDEFRPPANPYGTGNRGLTYRTRPGQPVRAAARGVVAFAGPVAGRLVVSIDHPDGLRTTYTGLGSIETTRGETVARDQVIGGAGTELHVGARVGRRTYLDPAALFGGRVRVHLVADPDAPRAWPPGFGDGPGALDWLVARAGDAATVGRALLSEAWAAGLFVVDAVVGLNVAMFELVDRALEAVEVFAATVDARLAYALALAREWSPRQVLERLWEVVEAWRAPCTEAGVPPPRVRGRRILVVVGGLHSSSGGTLVEDLGPEALGYDRADVVVFSYAGGAVPGTGSSLGLDGSGYRREHTEVPVERSAAELAALLDEVGRSAPGVPIDVVGHSLGGLVSRRAVSATSSDVATLVTLGAPLRGADLASVVSAVGAIPTVDATYDVVDWVDDVLAGDRLPDAGAPAVGDLAEWSEELRLPGAPEGTTITHVASRDDLTVSSRSSREDAGRWVVVDGGGHRDLPASAEARREIGLAVNGMPPTCRGLGGLLLDHLVGEGVSLTTDALGAGLVVLASRNELGGAPTRTDPHTP